MLPMQALSTGDNDMETNAGAPKSATQFFAIPKSKQSLAKPQPPGPPPASLGGGGPGVGRALPGGPPLAAGGPPAALPGAPPPGAFGAPPTMSGGPVGAPMSISGPVASGPTSQGGRTPFEVGQAPTAEQLPPSERGSSMRIYVIITALLFLCFCAMVTAVVVVVIGANTMGNDDPAPRTPTARVESKRPTPANNDGNQDTAAPTVAAPNKPPPPPPPPRTSRPRTSTSTASKPASSPPKASAPPGTVTIKLNSDAMFLGVQISCVPSGEKKRSALSGGSATVQGIPAGETCTLTLTGGPPARFQPVRAGNAYSCTYNGGTLVCK